MLLILWNIENFYTKYFILSGRGVHQIQYFQMDLCVCVTLLHSDSSFTEIRYLESN